MSVQKGCRAQVIINIKNVRPHYMLKMEVKTCRIKKLYVLQGVIAIVICRYICLRFFLCQFAQQYIFLKNAVSGKHTYNKTIISIEYTEFNKIFFKKNKYRTKK
jgi:hypothetical protein